MKAGIQYSYSLPAH